MGAANRLRTHLGSFALVSALCASQAALSQDPASPDAPAADAPAADAAAAPADADLAAMIEQGQKEYLANCRPCHGSKGTAGVPLAGNEKIAAGPDYLIWAVITGPGYMPELGAALSNEQIAAIATFVENSWGNSYGLVTPDDVEAAR
jgi:mono/diheme cytochrome c family protein